LDEFDPSAVSVIIPNFVLARTNCLDGTNLYSVCCENVCDPLMRQIETSVRGPIGTVPQILSLVQSLSSRSMAARDLPQSLVSKLYEVAALHDGQVPIHSRLFSEWMHHAFPMDCPSPTDANSMEFSPEEVAKISSGISSEEKQAYIEADTCSVNEAGKIECAGETEDLPWSGKQELLSIHHSVSPKKTASAKAFSVLLWLAAFAGLAALALPALSKTPQQKQIRPLAATLIVTAVGFSSGLIDGRLFSLGLLCVAVLQRDVLRRCTSKQEDLLPKNMKSI